MGLLSKIKNIPYSGYGAPTPKLVFPNMYVGLRYIDLESGRNYIIDDIVYGVPIWKDSNADVESFKVLEAKNYDPSEIDKEPLYARNAIWVNVESDERFKLIDTKNGVWIKIKSNEPPDYTYNERKGYKVGDIIEHNGNEYIAVVSNENKAVWAVYKDYIPTYKDNKFKLGTQWKVKSTNQIYISVFKDASQSIWYAINGENKVLCVSKPKEDIFRFRDGDVWINDKTKEEWLFKKKWYKTKSFDNTLSLWNVKVGSIVDIIDRKLQYIKLTDDIFAIYSKLKPNKSFNKENGYMILELLTDGSKIYRFDLEIDGDAYWREVLDLNNGVVASVVIESDSFIVDRSYVNGDVWINKKQNTINEFRDGVWIFKKTNGVYPDENFNFAAGYRIGDIIEVNGREFKCIDDGVWAEVANRNPDTIEPKHIKFWINRLSGEKFRKLDNRIWVNDKSNRYDISPTSKHKRPEYLTGDTWINVVDCSEYRLVDDRKGVWVKNAAKSKPDNSMNYEAGYMKGSIYYYIKPGCKECDNCSVVGKYKLLMFINNEPLWVLILGRTPNRNDDENALPMNFNIGDFVIDKNDKVWKCINDRRGRAEWKIVDIDTIV